MHIEATVAEGIKPFCYPKQMMENWAQKPAAMDSCFGLIRPHQHGTASRWALGSHIMNVKVMKNCGVVGCGLKWQRQNVVRWWLLSSIFHHFFGTNRILSFYHCRLSAHLCGFIIPLLHFDVDSFSGRLREVKYKGKDQLVILKSGCGH